MRAAHVVKWLGAATCAGLLVWAVRLLWPLPAWTPPKIAQPVSATQPAAAAKRGVGDYAVIWQRDLRQPVVDMPAPPPAVAIEPPLAIHLLGTAVADDQQLGIFALANNSIVVKKVGESLDGYELLSIARGEARLKRGDRKFDLRVPWFDQIASRGTD